MWDLMDKLNAADFYTALSDLRRNQTTIERDEELRKDGFVSDKHRNGYRKLVESLLPQMEILGAHGARAILRRLLIDLDGSKFRYRAFNEQVKTFDRILKDDLSHVSLFALSETDADYFEGKQPLFGPDVDTAFPGTATEDIAEAGKCLALGRGTATVFHLSRVMESAVRALGAKLGVKVIDKNNIDLEWGTIIANMNTHINGMPPGAAKNEWAEATAFLLHVKTAWRNPTMHPKQTYTPEEARNIFAAMNAFMRHLATLV